MKAAQSVGFAKWCMADGSPACCCWDGFQRLVRRNVSRASTTQEGQRRAITELGSNLWADIADNRTVRLPVLLMSGEQVASLNLRLTDTATQAMSQLREQYAPSGLVRLAWRSSVMRTDETVAKLGIEDGDHVYLVQVAQPHFDVVTSNAEAIEDGCVVRVLEDHRWTWGWAAAFTAPGVKSLSVRLGRTADEGANVTDYFIGALPDTFFKAQCCQNFLADCGVGLVLSSHSRWSGSLKIRGSHHNMPFGNRKFHPGDAVTVELDAATSSVRFAHGEEWSQPIESQFDGLAENIRLGVSLYCEMGHGPVRSLEICPCAAF